MDRFHKITGSQCIVHPILGKLHRHRGRGWQGTIAGNGEQVSVTVAETPFEPDATLLETASHVAQKLGYFKRLSYSFIEKEAFDLFQDKALGKPEDVQLYALQAFYPNRDWLKSMLKFFPSKFEAVTLDTPLATLQFSIPEDRNILDVTFVSETPTDLDYH